MADYAEAPGKEVSVMEVKIPWWKYVLAVITFVAIFFFGPVLVSLALQITNLFSPEAFRNTNEWIVILSDILGMVFACGSLEKIIGEKNLVFCMVVCIVAAFYCVAVSVWNYAIGITNFFEFIGLCAEGIVATYCAVSFGRESSIRSH